MNVAVRLPRPVKSVRNRSSTDFATVRFAPCAPNATRPSSQDNVCAARIAEVIPVIAQALPEQTTTQAIKAATRTVEAQMEAAVSAEADRTQEGRPDRAAEAAATPADMLKLPDGLPARQAAPWQP